MSTTRPATQDPAINILVIAFEAGRWGPARLVKSLHESGFKVAVLCPPGNALAQTRYLDRLFPLNDVRSSRHVEQRLAAAIQAWQPRLVIPADDSIRPRPDTSRTHRP